MNKTELKNSIYAGLAFSVGFGIFQLISYNIERALIVGPISGVIFGVAIYFFTTSKTVKSQTQVENPDGTSILHSGGANHFKKGEAVGGKLYLMSDKIQFQSHSFNIQNHSLIIEMKDIKEVVFFNSLGIVPNGLKIITKDGNTEKFVVNGRKTWKSEIEKLML
jgi:hypothetical protein